MPGRLLGSVRHPAASGGNRSSLCHVSGLDDPGGIFLDPLPQRQMERIPGNRIDKKGGTAGTARPAEGAENRLLQPAGKEISHVHTWLI